MEKLEKTEMQKIKGGGVSIWVIIGIGVAITFISGVIDGFVHPKDC